MIDRRVCTDDDDQSRASSAMDGRISPNGIADAGCRHLDEGQPAPATQGRLGAVYAASKRLLPQVVAHEATSQRRRQELTAFHCGPS